jgi:importin subunit alpha-2
LSKRRNLDTEEEILNLSDTACSYTLMPIEDIVNGINSGNEEIQLLSTQTCRKLLSREKNPPINSMIERGIVERCVDLLDYDHK